MPEAEEVARAATEEMWRDDAASRMLGMVVRRCGPGAAAVEMRVRADMLNGWGSCHGGLVAAVADSAFAVACNSHGEVTVAAGFDVVFLAPSLLDDVLVATATERVRRGRSGVYDVDVVRESDGELVACFRGRSRSTGRPNPGLS